MADLGGFVGGMLAGQEYAQNKQLFGLKMAEGAQALQEGALSIKDKDLAVQKSQLLLDQQKKMMSYINTLNSRGTQDATDTTVSQANLLGQVGEAQIGSGMFEEGRKTLETKTLMLQQNETIIQRTNAVKVKQLQEVSEILGSSGDSPQGWDQARQMVTTLHPDLAKLPDVQKILQLPYKPGLVNAIQASVMSQKDKAQAEEAKAGTAVRYAEAQEHLVRTRDILPAEAENVRLRNDKLRQAGGDTLVATKDDIAAITNRIQSDPDIGGKVPKEAAGVVGEKIAEQVAAYRKQGMSLAKASDKAYEEAKQRGELKGLTKPTPQQTTVETLIDDIIARAQASKGGEGVTGLRGMVNRPKETVENTLGLSDKTQAHDFESQVKALQLMLPKALLSSGQYTKVKQAEISKIARGVNLGDTPENVISAMEQLKQALNLNTPAKGGVMSLEDYLKAQEGK